MDEKHKYNSTQTSMLRWYYQINKDISGNIFVKKNYEDKSYIRSIYFEFKNIGLITDIKDNFCQLEYLYWIDKNQLTKLTKAPNGEDFGMPYYVNGSTSVIPSPGYHLLTNHPTHVDGYYYIFSLYDPYY